VGQSGAAHHVREGHPAGRAVIADLDHLVPALDRYGRAARVRLQRDADAGLGAHVQVQVAGPSGDQAVLLVAVVTGVRRGILEQVQARLEPLRLAEPDRPDRPDAGAVAWHGGALTPLLRLEPLELTLVCGAFGSHRRVGGRADPGEHPAQLADVHPVHRPDAGQLARVAAGV